jgi:hypothetical protein
MCSLCSVKRLLFFSSMNCVSRTKTNPPSLLCPCAVGKDMVNSAFASHCASFLLSNAENEASSKKRKKRCECLLCVRNVVETRTYLVCVLRLQWYDTTVCTQFNSKRNQFHTRCISLRYVRLKMLYFVQRSTYNKNQDHYVLCCCPGIFSTVS